MEYKGQHISDTKDIKRYENIDKFTNDFSNEIELGIEELDELKDLIRKKESELKEKGVKFSDVKIEMIGYDESYNPNGRMNRLNLLPPSLGWRKRIKRKRRNESSGKRTESIRSLKTRLQVKQGQNEYVWKNLLQQ